MQIPLLLKYQQDNIALNKAVESGNTDLIYMVLLHMQTSMPLGKFQVSFEFRNKELCEVNLQVNTLLDIYKHKVGCNNHILI